MARELSLLDRLRTPERERRLSALPDPAVLSGSVLDNLRRLLNTRQGRCVTRPEYGIPSLEDVRFGGMDGVKELARDIQLSIERFEPRLQRVRVRVLPRTEELTTVRFEIVAELVTPDGRSRVAFETRLDDSGRLVVGG